MLASMKQLRSKRCRRWFSTTMHPGQRMNGLWKRTEMHFQGFCNRRTNFFYLIFICYLIYPCMFAENRFRPRILIDVSKIDLSTTVFGSKISMPIMVAPTGQHQMAHPEGIDIASSLLTLKFICWLLQYSKTCKLKPIVQFLFRRMRYC